MARRKNKSSLIFLLILILAGGIWGASRFDFFGLIDVAGPEIIVADELFNNGQSPISIGLKDEKSGLKRVRIILKKSEDDPGVILANQKLTGQKDLLIQVSLPRTAYKERIDSYQMQIELADASLLGLFGLNTSSREVKITIDKTSPRVRILANSYQIEQGGAGAVVFSAGDVNLKEVYIQTNKGQIFKATPYVREGYFAALIAWDVRQRDFRAYVIATDEAGNTTKERIHYYLLNRKYRVSKIKLNEKFLEGKISTLYDEYAPQNTSGEEVGGAVKFHFVNETLRVGNEKLIHEKASQVPEKMIEGLELQAFLPLKNGMRVGDFADHRYYHYQDKLISESYHLGLDLASTAKAPILNSNKGRVVFAGDNGIYGLNLIIYHGLGLYSLYAHCSAKQVDVDEEVAHGEGIARTGTSGLALGDHLHFGVLIQGVEVRPEQWMDKKWINTNILSVLAEGKKIILGGSQ